MNTIRFGALFALIPLACAPVLRQTYKQNSQKIEIRTIPPKADLWLQDENGTRRLGHSPVRLDAGYNALVTQPERDACAGYGALEGMHAGLDVADNGHEAAILGVIGLVAGASIGAAACSGPPVVTIEPRQLQVTATLPGYLPAMATLRVPHQSGVFTIELAKDPNGSARNGSATAREPMKTPPAERRVEEPAFLAERNTEPLRGVLAVYAVSIEAKPFVPSSVLTELLQKALERSGFLPLEKGASPAAHRELLVRVLRKDDLCLLSATLQSLPDRRPIKVAGAQSRCEIDALKEAFVRLVEQLPREQLPPTPPPPPVEEN